MWLGAQGTNPAPVDVCGPSSASPTPPVPCFLSRGTHLPEGIPELEMFPSVCHSAWVASGCLVRGPVAETSDQSQGSANS